jgi:hypothetical protein
VRVGCDRLTDFIRPGMFMDNSNIDWVGNIRYLGTAFAAGSKLHVDFSFA